MKTANAPAALTRAASIPFRWVNGVWEAPTPAELYAMSNATVVYVSASGTATIKAVGVSRASH
jgi:hypothetical protein